MKNAAFHHDLFFLYEEKKNSKHFFHDQSLDFLIEFIVKFFFSSRDASSEQCEEKALKGPYLLKVDVEGAEMDVMDGASKTLEMTDVVILEVTFIARLINAPEFTDIIKHMDGLGFVAYDIYDLTTKGEDDFLFQANMTFVKRDSAFRKH